MLLAAMHVSLDTTIEPFHTFPSYTNFVQKEKINDHLSEGETINKLAGRLLALDPGEKRVGIAVSDELHLTVRPLETLRVTSWKKLLVAVKELLAQFDAKALVIGLPLTLDGSERSAAIKARDLARKFALSLDVPVFMQDERLTSQSAEESLRISGHQPGDFPNLLDCEAAAIILRDFISRFNDKPPESTHDIGNRSKTRTN